MPLQPMRQSFPIVGGQEQSVAPELIDPPVLTMARNVVCHREGELTKRFGWIAEADNAEILPIPDRLALRGNEIVWIGDEHDYNGASGTQVVSTLFSRVVGESQEVSNSLPWKARGYIPRFNISVLREVATQLPNSHISDFDCAYAGTAGDTELRRGVVCIVWKYVEDSSRVDYAVIDIATESVLASGIVTSAVAARGQIRVVALRHPGQRWFFHVFAGKLGNWTDETSDQGDVSRFSIDASRPQTVVSRGDFFLGITGWDICTAYPEPVTGESEAYHGLYGIVTLLNDARPLLYAFRAGASGTLSLESLEYAYGSGPSGTVPNAYTVHLACDPNGRHVGATWNAGGSTGGQTAADRIATWGVDPSPNTTITAEGIGTVAGDSTQSGRNRLENGMQIGWAGWIQGETEREYRYWKITWGPTISRTTQWGMHTVEAPAYNGLPSLGVASHLYSQSFHPWSRLWNYHGVTYGLTLRGGAADCVGIEVTEIRGTLGDVTMRPRSHARALRGRIATTVVYSGAGISGTYPSHRGRNSVVESHVDPGTFYAAVPVVSQNGLAHQIALMAISAVDPQQYSYCEYGGCTWIACGLPWCYDGSRGHEIGFAHRPQLYRNINVSPAIYPGEIYAAPVEATGSAMTPGDYLVAMTWEATDESGRYVESAASYANGGTAPITVSADETIRVIFTPIGITSRAPLYNQDVVVPVVYVSNDGGLNYYRSMQPIPDVNESTPDSPVEVDLDPQYLFTAGAPKLAAVDGLLENDPLPAMRFVTAWQNRIWFANDFEIWPSCEVLDNEEPRFNSALVIKLPARCSGLIGLDDRLLVFGMDSIYWISGDGPTDTGQGGSFTIPQRISSDLGCIDARSICRTSKGILFQSRRGIELMDGSLVPNRISGGVDWILNEQGYSEIIGASLDPEYQIVRFVARAPGTTLIQILDWHVSWGFWTVESSPVIPFGSTNIDACYGIVRAGNSNWIGIAGYADGSPACTLAQQSRTFKFDGRREDQLRMAYHPSIDTANIKLDGLRGFQRIWRAYCLVKDRGTGARNTGFAMGYNVDYSGVPGEIFTASTAGARTWTTEAEAASGYTASGRHWEYSVHVSQQQGSSIRLRFAGALITDATSTPIDTDITFVGFGIEYGIEPGTGKSHWRSKK